jgi:CrcB protein
MNASALLAIGVGAVLGAWLRYGLGLWLNPLFVTMPLGTLAANLVGGYLVGVAVGLFHLHAGLPPPLKLFVITGFLGGLTTFSTFSAEVVERLLAGQFLAGLGVAFVHLAGSLLLTALGLYTVGAHRLWSAT